MQLGFIDPEMRLVAGVAEAHVKSSKALVEAQLEDAVDDLHADRELSVIVDIGADQDGMEFTGAGQAEQHGDRLSVEIADIGDGFTRFRRGDRVVGIKREIDFVIEKIVFKPSFSGASEESKRFADFRLGLRLAMVVMADVALGRAGQASEFFGEFAADGSALPGFEIVSDLAVIGGIFAWRCRGLPEQPAGIEAVIANLPEDQYAGDAKQGVDPVEDGLIPGKGFKHARIPDDAIVVADAEISRLQNGQARRFLNDERDQREQRLVVPISDCQRVLCSAEIGNQLAVDRIEPQGGLEHRATLQIVEGTVLRGQEIEVRLDVDGDIELKRLLADCQHQVVLSLKRLTNSGNVGAPIFAAGVDPEISS